MNRRKSSIILTLIFAGEAIFFLPFVLARIFRPTLLVFFNVSNVELGSWFSWYGVTAMVSYVLGGPLADRFPARRLMALALLLTAFGGFILFLLHGKSAIAGLYIFWGFTTICLFWAAMIRATREWGGGSFQGRAFGWLEGGRGLVAALLGTAALLLFRDAGNLSRGLLHSAGGIHPFQLVILASSFTTIIAGVFVWIFVPDTKPSVQSMAFRTNIKRIRILAQKPGIWILVGLIICAYAGYKITDDYSLFAREVLGFSEVGAAGVGTAALWLRAIVAILAGILGDRVDRSRVIMFCFALSLVSGIVVGAGILEGTVILLFINLALTAAGIYGVRALYFAVLEEAEIPFGYTGTAVGIVSFLGFSPEIFMGPWMGMLLDEHPGVEGHRFVFLLMALFALAGLLLAFVFRKRYLRLPEPPSA